MIYGNPSTTQIDPIVQSFQKDVHDLLLSFGGESVGKMTPEEKASGGFQSLYSSLKIQAVNILNPTDTSFYSMNGSEQIRFLIDRVNQFLEKNPAISKRAPLSLQYLQERIVAYRDTLKDLLKDPSNNQARIESFGGKKSIKSLYSLFGPLSLTSDKVGMSIVVLVSLVSLGYGVSRVIPYISKQG